MSKKIEHRIRTEINTAYENIESFRDKLGETFNDMYMEDDNSTYEVAKSIINVFDSCKTDRDFEMANRMLVAICGWSITSIINKIEERDTNGHLWISC